MSIRWTRRVRFVGDSIGTCNVPGSVLGEVRDEKSLLRC
jgi:hypothetical protein